MYANIYFSVYIYYECILIINASSESSALANQQDVHLFNWNGDKT